MELIIRQETKNDFAAVFQLIISAFSGENEAKLVEALRLSNTFIPELSLVAIIDHKIVGHILFTKIKIVDEKQNEVESLALAPLAVKPEFQKNGIGGKLIKAGLAKATSLNFKSVFVLGHKNYYPKFGFIPSTQWNIKSTFDVPIEAFMGIELINGGLERVTGTVKYPKEFEIV